MEIFTRENIKVTEAHLLYSVLSMIAEIGGYVGLFLGVSIIQINHVFDKVIKMACDNSSRSISEDQEQRTSGPENKGPTWSRSMEPSSNGPPGIEKMTLY